MLIDVHCHLDYFPDNKIDEFVKNARKNKVATIISNGTNAESNRKVLKLSEKYSEVKCALGIFPIDALNMTEEEFEKEIEFIRRNRKKIVAIGEVGIDLKESNDLKKQTENFLKFVRLSKEIDKPVIVHSRKAEKEIIDILEKEKIKKVVMHCFCGNFRLVKKILENEWKITIPTSAKRSEHFQKIIEIAPMKNLLCETDSPFLNPERDGDNQPANVIWSYEKISEIKKINLREVEEIIEKNYSDLFSS